MSIKWVEGRFGTEHAKAGRVEMSAYWSTIKADKCVGACEELGLYTKGHADMADAKAAIERMTRDALTEAQAAFE